jgi:hypothetical protein
VPVKVKENNILLSKNATFKRLAVVEVIALLTEEKLGLLPWRRDKKLNAVVNNVPQNN